MNCGNTFHIYRTIWFNSGVRDLLRVLLSICELRANRCREGHRFLVTCRVPCYSMTFESKECLGEFSVLHLAIHRAPSPSISRTRQCYSCTRAGKWHRRL
jgi:hypothetical protein